MAGLLNSNCGSCGCGDSDYTWIITDGVTSQTLSNGESLTVNSGLGISAVVSASDILTISVDLALGQLNNVDTSGVSDGDVLTYNSGSGEWEPAASTSFTCNSLSACSIGDLSDVVLTSPSDGQVLGYDGTNWTDLDVIWNLVVDGGSNNVIAIQDATAAPSTVEFISGDGIQITLAAGPDLTFAIDTSTASNGDILSFNGTNVEWIANSGGGGGGFQCQQLASCSITLLSDVEVGTPSDGDYLVYNSGSGLWEFSSTSPSFTGITLDGDSGTAQLLEDGDTFQIVGGTGISTIVSATDTLTINLDATLSDLTDVPAEPTGGTDMHILVWDENTNTFSWSLVGGGSFVCSALNTCSIDDLSDVDTTTVTPSSGDFMKFDGSDWVPETVPSMTIDYFNTSAQVPNGGTTVTLSSSPTSIVAVFRNGVLQQPTIDWSNSGTTVTFTDAFTDVTTSAGTTNETITVIYFA